MKIDWKLRSFSKKSCNLNFLSLLYQRRGKGERRQWMEIEWKFLSPSQKMFSILSYLFIMLTRQGKIRKKKTERKSNSKCVHHLSLSSLFKFCERLREIRKVIVNEHFIYSEHSSTKNKKKEFHYISY